MPIRVLIYRSMMLKGCRGLLFLNEIVLHVVVSYKYIGHCIIGYTDDLSDDEDINRQRRTLFFQGNYSAKVSRCETHTLSCLWFTYVHHAYSTTLGELQKKSTISSTKLQIAGLTVMSIIL